LTRKAYCEGMGISISRLGYYVRREGEQARKEAKLLPVEVAAASSPSPLTLVLGGGLRLEVSAGFDEVTLRRLLAVIA
jgi:hypothetical protein